MKTRKQIEDQMKDVTAPSGTAKLYRLFVDLMLDIRELLIDDKNYRMEEKVRRDRELVRQKRIQKMLENKGGE